jgi:hypothetical protein
MRGGGLALALSFFALGGTAHAAILVTPEGQPAPSHFQRWADASSVPTPSATIIVRQKDCRVEGRRCGMAIPPYAASDPPLLGEIWLPFNGQFTHWQMVTTVWHELGHHFDYAMPNWVRTLFLRLMGQPTRPWRGSPNSPHEQFAEAYRLCAEKLAIRKTMTSGGYLWLPTPRQHRRACKLINDAASTMGAAVHCPSSTRACWWPR